jgi:hypothetical protein
MELKRAGSSEENIAYKVLTILIDYESDLKSYNNAIEDYKSLGGIDGIAENLGWDANQKLNWTKRIQSVNSIK